MKNKGKEIFRRKSLYFLLTIFPKVTIQMRRKKRKKREINKYFCFDISEAVTLLRYILYYISAAHSYPPRPT